MIISCDQEGWTYVEMLLCFKVLWWQWCQWSDSCCVQLYSYSVLD